jgi:hypothetical protein
MSSFIILAAFYNIIEQTGVRGHESVLDVIF